MKTKFSQSLSAYRELIQTGGIRSTGEGDHVFLEINGSMAGDVLVFVIPRNKRVTTLPEIYELIQTDSTLPQQRDIAFKSLRQKYKGLSLLPASLVWSLNIVISTLYVYLNSNSVRGLFIGGLNLTEILALLPVAGSTTITYFLIKVYGLKILQPFLFLVIKGIKLLHKARNRKIA